MPPLVQHHLKKKIAFETIIMCLLHGMWDFSINQLFCQILEDMDIVIECNCVIFRWLLLNSKCAKSIFENLVNRHLMIFTHSHSKSRTPILKVAIYIGAHLGPILRVAPILKVQFPTQGCIYSQPKRSQPPPHPPL